MIEATPTHTLNCQTTNWRAAPAIKQSIRIWDVDNGTMLYQLEGHDSQVYSLALLSNEWMASGLDNGEITHWDEDDDGKEIRTLEL